MCLHNNWHFIILDLHVVCKVSNSVSISEIFSRTQFLLQFISIYIRCCILYISNPEELKNIVKMLQKCTKIPFSNYIMWFYSTYVSGALRICSAFSIISHKMLLSSYHYIFQLNFLDKQIVLMYILLAYWNINFQGEHCYLLRTIYTLRFTGKGVKLIFHLLC